MEMHSVDSTESRENKKKIQQEKHYLSVGMEPITFMHATVWANSPFAGSLGPLDPKIVMLCWFFDFSRYQRVKEFHLLAHMGRMWSN